jgi:hypothetical protein
MKDFIFAEMDPKTLHEQCEELGRLRKELNRCRDRRDMWLAQMADADMTLACELNARLNETEKKMKELRTKQYRLLASMA